MTILITTTLQCQGKAGACTATVTAGHVTAAELRSSARAGGWKAANDGSKDLCPACAGPAPAGTCDICREHAEVEYRDVLGHDGLGHRLANLLASHGVVTFTQLLELTPPRLRKMRGLGEGGAGRIAWAQNNPTERFRT